MTIDCLPDTARTAHVSFANAGPTVAAEAKRMGLNRLLLVATPGRATSAAAIGQWLGERVAGSFAEAAMHTPVAVTERAAQLARQVGADGIVAIGGGSAIGLGKAIARRTDLPQIAVPTTYAGSEMTPVLGETSDGVKTTVRDAALQPQSVVYDVSLTLDLPVPVSIASGMNAVAHAAEALYARDTTPAIARAAEEAIGLFARALPAIVRDPRDPAARSQALRGACLAGMCLGTVGMALHHKLCHVLGGAFGLPHAETHMAVLPHALAYNAPATPEAMAAIARAMGAADAPLALYDLVGALGGERSLRALGMPETGIEVAVEQTLSNPYWNPRPIVRAPIEALLRRAFDGAPPETDNTDEDPQ